MNDFTKEELIYLRDAIFISEKPPELYRKVQSMIDNYCDCEETVCIGGWVYKCVKCGMKFGDETQ